MNRRTLHIVAALVVLIALTSDWLTSELFLRRDTNLNIVLALAINAGIVIGVYALLAAAGRERAGLMWLRAFIYVGFLAAILNAFRENIVSLEAYLPHLRMLLGIAGFACGIALVYVLDDATSERVIRAVLAASFAFAIVPFAWQALTGRSLTWVHAPSAASGPQKAGVAIVLLDEMGYGAAAPLADDLRQAHLNVQYAPMISSGQNTENVVPRMFSGLDFSQSRPCGISSLCSGSNRLDFAGIRAGRDDIDVAGLLFPYCDIQGLRSCYAMPLAHDFGNAYASLLSFYLHRVGTSLPAFLGPRPLPDNDHHRLLNDELAFIAKARFWSEGGVLYAHLPLPHPPGLDRTSQLDRDYSDNVAASRAIVRALAQRLRASFGDRFSLILFSDHGLRAYWCQSGTYRGANCLTRPLYHDKRVPLIVATPSPAPRYRPASNAAIFSVLDGEVRRLLH
ncbi:MAG TPA: hypothetical protein VNU97_13670 [Rhizomicrobium sp.]|jgi:hypothetical protein|nr:hypothetical protein [Rhizomicrobium sp.]